MTTLNKALSALSIATPADVVAVGLVAVWFCSMMLAGAVL